MRKILLAALVTVCVAPQAVRAQAAGYPALQPSRVVEREYNFALTDFGGGTVLLAQWREALNGPRQQLTLEGGIVDGPGEAALVLGGSFHYQLRRETADLPFDMVLGGGLGVTTGNGANNVYIPVGVSIGRRLAMRDGYHITPFVHPRIAFNRASSGGVRSSETDIELDLGASFELNARMQVRLAIGLADATGVGLSFAWVPPGLRR